MNRKLTWSCFLKSELSKNITTKVKDTFPVNTMCVPHLCPLSTPVTPVGAFTFPVCLHTFSLPEHPLRPALPWPFSPHFPMIPSKPCCPPHTHISLTHVPLDRTLFQLFGAPCFTICWALPQLLPTLSFAGENKSLTRRWHAHRTEIIHGPVC